MNATAAARTSPTARRRHVREDGGYSSLSAVGVLWRDRRAEAEATCARLHACCVVRPTCCWTYAGQDQKGGFIWKASLHRRSRYDPDFHPRVMRYGVHLLCSDVQLLAKLALAAAGGDPRVHCCCCSLI
jgi:hypothetical protein